MEGSAGKIGCPIEYVCGCELRNNCAQNLCLPSIVQSRRPAKEETVRQIQLYSEVLTEKLKDLNSSDSPNPRTMSLNSSITHRAARSISRRPRSSLGFPNS